MDTIVATRDKKLEWILGLRVWINTKVNEDTLYETLEVRSVRLDAVWKELQEIETNLATNFPGAECKAGEFEDTFFDIKGVLLNLMRKRQPPPAAVPLDNNLGPILTQLYQQQQTVLEGLQNNNRTMVQTLDRENVRLPTVSIEPFDGVYRNWPSFEDAYTTTIHNNDNISKTTKFKLLKRVLSDGPLSLIKNMIETDANYEEAWTKLKSRYSKKKLILTSYITTFLDQPTVTSGKAADIRALSDKSDELIVGIRTMGNDAEYRDAWLIQILLRKLDDATRQEWSKEVVDVDFPTFDKFQKFLNTRCDSLEDGMTNIEKRQSRPPTNDKPPKPSARNFMADANSINCMHCHKPGHILPRCIKFKFLPPFIRRNIAVQLGLCLNCLQSGHDIKSCSSSSKCRICQQNHHTLIHIKQPQPNNQSNQPAHSQSSNNTSTSASTQNINSVNSQSAKNFKVIAKSNTVLNSVLNNVSSSRLAVLPTALVSVRSSTGTNHFAFALLDSGSQCSFISEALVQRLGLTRSSSFLSVTGLGCTNAASTRGVVNIALTSRFSLKDQILLNAHILSSITVLKPVDAPAIPNWSLIKDLDLADPKFNKRKDIDLLLGSDVFFDVIKPDKIRDGDITIAQNSLFGWVVLSPPNKHVPSASSFTAVVNDQDLLSAMKRFWELEEPPEMSPFSPSEKTCEEFYETHTLRDEDGRYVTRLPFKDPPPVLGHSKNAAISRLLTMERRFEKDTALMDQYHTFMQEYRQLRHMELVPPHEQFKPDSDVFYLPHHAVVKPDSATTKLRVVFDGSCKSSTKISLNDALLIGPTIQDDLITILSRFRIHPIVFSSDIEKMYRQVRINALDTDYQRIVWRDSPSEPIATYRLNTVTYGTSCAPFLAVRTLHQIANENQTIHPHISELLKRDFYIDDLLSGCENVQDAVATVNTLSAVLSQAGMHIRKWKSNCVAVLQDVADVDKDPSVLEFDSDLVTVKTLGVRWNPKTDIFSFSINVAGLTPSPTKRQFLSQVSKIFDPLGWVTPAIVPLKILFQKLWTRQVAWDDQLPPDIESVWNDFRQELHKLEEVKIPRHVYITSDAVTIQIHGFADASEVAYAAVVYIAVIDHAGIVKSNIVLSKSKVAPIKQISLPRLELCGALLLSKLICFVTTIIRQTNPEVYAWTDSEIVIAWLSDVPRRWKTFIANRTSEILTRVPRQSWRHVPSKDNPADCASRGVSPSNLPDHHLWWNGPPWMIQPQTTWPPQRLSPVIVPEARESAIAVHTITPTQPVAIDIEEILHRFSKYHTIKKIFCFILRFGSYKHRKKSMASLMAIADRLIVVLVQKIVFHDEIKALQSRKLLPRHNKLSPLTPFVDSDDVLRVGGRLKNSVCPYDAKHPMIIPANHRLTTLIIRESHQRNLHPGPSLQMSLLKQKYWIISGRDLVRRLINSCMTCFRQKAQITEQLMGNIPAKRLTPSRPFLTTGVDYAGPILLKSRPGRGNVSILKGYVCLFVCLTTKAIHLELVSDMTSSAFIAALRRFCGRRGVPAEIVSDNGTNFIGAANELHELYLLFKSTVERNLIFDFFTENQIQFSFNPASAPHFGGIWEANIKSMKHHVRRATSDSKLTFEEMATLLCQIESLLNSRPLYAMTYFCKSEVIWNYR